MYIYIYIYRNLYGFPNICFIFSPSPSTATQLREEDDSKLLKDVKVPATWWKWQLGFQGLGFKGLRA